MDAFVLSVIILIIICFGTGVLLLARNTKPMLGFLLIVISVALIIGISMDAQAMKREIINFWKTVSKVF
jgi:ABC-type multidrug transport system permease subunit